MFLSYFLWNSKQDPNQYKLGPKLNKGNLITPHHNKVFYNSIPTLGPELHERKAVILIFIKKSLTLVRTALGFTPDPFFKILFLTFPEIRKSVISLGRDFKAVN